MFRVYGSCRNLNLTDEYYNPDFDKTVGLKYSYDENGWFEVGEYFGCIHFKKIKCYKRTTQLPVSEIILL